LFRQLKSRIAEGVGIDPAIDRSIRLDNVALISGRFPQDLPDTQPFDVITMLAVLEHIPTADQPKLAADCARLLRPNGHVVITVPSAAVDRLLIFLKSVHLIDGMKLEEHHGFDANTTPSIFSTDALKLIRADKFQFGLNNLFVFRKTG
jgi:hypothetical protein